MDELGHALPPAERVQTALRQVLEAPGLTIAARWPNPYRGAFPSERVTCDAPGGAHWDLFVKYGRKATHSGHGYWGGVSHEAWVYQTLLPRTGLHHPKCFGTYEDPESGQTWLVLEGLDPSEQLFRGQATRDEAIATLRETAAWIARFHARLSEPHSSDIGHALPRYDRGYFMGWIARTGEYARPLLPELPWLEDLLLEVRSVLATLGDGNACVIHGELYPSNVLVCRGGIYPVDWQSTAIGPGEIDLASLLEGWEDSGVFDELVSEYGVLRWGHAPPANLPERVRAATLYWPLRWLGDDPAWTRHRRRRHYFSRLRSAWRRYTVHA